MSTDLTKDINDIHMRPTAFPHKVNDYILYNVGDMIGSGTVFEIRENEIIVQTGNGGRGLEYIDKSQVLPPQSAINL